MIDVKNSTLQSYRLAKALNYPEINQVVLLIPLVPSEDRIAGALMAIALSRREGISIGNMIKRCSPFHLIY